MKHCESSLPGFIPHLILRSQRNANNRCNRSREKSLYSATSINDNREASKSAKGSVPLRSLSLRGLGRPQRRDTRIMRPGEGAHHSGTDRRRTEVRNFAHDAIKCLQRSVERERRGDFRLPIRFAGSGSRTPSPPEYGLSDNERRTIGLMAWNLGQMKSTRSGCG
jgi:hypothetical protein